MPRHSSPALRHIAQASPHRTRWLKTLYQWHWISSALSLLGILLFSLTGITLNHAGEIEADPVITQYQRPLPPELVTGLEIPAHDRHPLPAEIAYWVKEQWNLDISGEMAEWSAGEIYLSLPRPGGDAWLRIDLATHLVEYEITRRGWIAYLNDLHKGRHTGAVWRGFIDALGIACLLFTVTGLLILKMHAERRRSIWPLTGLGVVIPVLLALLFIH